MVGNNVKFVSGATDPVRLGPALLRRLRFDLNKARPLNLSKVGQAKFAPQKGPRPSPSQVPKPQPMSLLGPQPDQIEI